MIEKKDFAKNFNGLAIPNELEKLLDFDNSISQKEFYVEGFELQASDGKDMLKTYSNDNKFLNALMEIAQASHSGSTYNMWIRNNNTNIHEIPIVVFGDEGGFHVVAENIYGLFQILTFDVEPRVDWDGVYYYKDEEDFEASPKSDAFKKWLFDNFKITPTNNANEIVKSAQEKFGNEFKEWMKIYDKE